MVKKEKDELDKLLDHFDLRGKSPDEIVGENGLLRQLTSRLLQKALQAEMDEHLGYEKNSNSGYSEKTVLTGDNKSVEITVLRTTETAHLNRT